MKVAIWADMEGASGLSDIRMCSPLLPEYYSEGQKLITDDIINVIKGVNEVTKAEIDVWDGHGGGGNILSEEFPESVNYVKRGGYSLFDSAMTGEINGIYDALIMVGMHAMTGTRDGFYSHTNMTHIAMKVNGQFTGEIAQIAWVFASWGTPTVMIAGDDATSREARAFLPEVDTAVVKNSITRAETVCLPMPAVKQRITSAASGAIRNINNFNVYPPPAPISLEVLFNEEKVAYNASRALPKTCYVDEYTVRYECEEIIEALKTYQQAMQFSASTSSEIISRLRKLDGAGKVMREWAEERYAKNLQTDPPFPIVKF